MARHGKSHPPRRGLLVRVRWLLTSSFLIVGGLALGVVIGTVWPAPAIIRDWLRGPVHTVVLEKGAASRQPLPLEVFRQLQAGSKGRGPPPRSRMPDVSAPPPERSSRHGAAGDSWGTSREDLRGSGGAAARVLADLEKRTREGPSPTSAGSPGEPRPPYDDPLPPTRRIPLDAVVQVGSYLERPTAEALVRRMRRQGFDAYITDARPGGEVRFRVRVRPRAEEGIEDLATRAREHGFSVWVTRE